jgi:hypothetical protein
MRRGASLVEDNEVDASSRFLIRRSPQKSSLLFGSSVPLNDLAIVS